MLMGQFNQKVDTKGRAIVPAKIREEIGSTFVITKGIEKCIYGFPIEKWEQLAEKLNELSLTDKNVRKFIRFFLAGATTLEIDGQGRVLLPQVLREYASLEKDVVWIGAGSRLEIWNPDKFIEDTTFDEEELDDLAEYMAGLGI